MGEFVAGYFDTSVVAYQLPKEDSATVQSMYEEADDPETSALVELELSAAPRAAEDLILLTADRQLARNSEAPGVRTELVGQQPGT